MSCKNCGTPIDHIEKFCPNCGHEISENERIHPKKGSSLWFLFFIGALIVVIGSLFLSGSEVTEPVKEQLNALKENKITEAYYNYTSKNFQEITPLETFHNSVKDLPLFLKDKTFDVKENVVENDTASVDAIVSNAKGVSTLFRFELIKENGKWKILAIQLANPSQPEITAAVNETVTTPSPSNVPNVATNPESTATTKKEENFDSKPLYKLIEGQLEQIQKKDFIQAYYRFSSHDFQPPS